LACLTYALYLDDRLEHSRELARHLIDISAVYLLAHQLSQAESVWRLAMPIQRELAVDFELSWAFLVEGRLFLAQERFSSAIDSLQQAKDAARTANRTDIQFEAAVRLPRAQWLAGKLDGDSAFQQLEAMLDKDPSLYQEAAIYYERWWIGKNAAHRVQARRAYEALLEKSYTAEAVQRARELGALKIPPITAVPPLPGVVTETPLNLDALLDKIIQSLA
jgi:tetratricopeptide (TPR) repeat protein